MEVLSAEESPETLDLRRDSKEAKGHTLKGKKLTVQNSAEKCENDRPKSVKNSGNLQTRSAKKCKQKRNKHKNLQTRLVIENERTKTNNCKHERLGSFEVQKSLNCARCCRMQWFSSQMELIRTFSWLLRNLFRIPSPIGPLSQALS